MMRDQRSRMWRWSGSPWLVIVVIVLLASLSGRAQTKAQPGTAEANPLAALHFRFIGPQGNRLDSVIGEPGNPNILSVGAADGGIWKSEDGGGSWRPIFDHEDVSPVGALAM